MWLPNVSDVAITMLFPARHEKGAQRQNRNCANDENWHLS
jgi:hypothetical protein